LLCVDHRSLLASALSRQDDSRAGRNLSVAARPPRSTSSDSSTSAAGQRPVDDPVTLLMVGVPTRPEHHRAQAQRTDLDPGLAQCSILHRQNLPRYGSAAVSQTAPTIPDAAAGEGPSASSSSRLARWRHALSTVNPPAGQLDGVSRWLVITRAGVLPMTLTAGAVAGLLAVRHPGFAAGWFALSFVGIVLAHVSNNLLNDLLDTDAGLDSENYPRALYAPHPILSGMITRDGLVRAAAAVNLADLVILAVLIGARGWVILAFGLAGLALNIVYTAPPLRLKKHGLGELDVLVVWGPLMIGGTYYAATGSVPWQVWPASIPYGLLCTAVLSCPGMRRPGCAPCP
jgi:hypothetical protein